MFPAVKKAGCEHIPYVTGGGAESIEKPEFIWVNTMIGNVKNFGALWLIRFFHVPHGLSNAMLLPKGGRTGIGFRFTRK